MKYRESGMPSEQLWDTFFSPAEILGQMGVDKQVDTLIDFGCGYGTFLLPAAGLIGGRAVGIDIDKEMIETCRKKITDENISNVELVGGDISEEETIKALEKYRDRADYVTLFNILHCEEPLELLRKSYALLRDNGRIGVIHWISEKTPRGPSMDIRPRPETIMYWAVEAGFVFEKRLNLPPYHFGMIYRKSSSTSQERL